MPSWPVPLTQGISPDEELIDMSAPAAATPTATASAPVASQPQEQTQQDAERQAQEEAARKAAQEEAARKAAQEEAARKAAQEEAARQAAQEQAAAQKAAQEEAERRAREDAEQRAREEEAQRTQERAAEEERKAREEAQRQEEAARQAEADARQAREEAERQARDDAARQQRQAQQAQQPQAYVPTAYPLDDDESGGASGQTINGMSFDNSRGGLAASLLGNDPYSPPLSPAVGSRAYNSATTSTVTVRLGAGRWPGVAPLCRRVCRCAVCVSHLTTAALPPVCRTPQRSRPSRRLPTPGSARSGPHKTRPRAGCVYGALRRLWQRV